MRIRDFREDDTPEINLIPMIDVVLCLIIFFVVTATFDARSVLKLQLPQANGQPAEAQAKALSVLVNADGRTPHQAVVTALDALGQLGFSRVSIATAPPVQPQPAPAR